MIIVFMKTRLGFHDALAAVALPLLMVGCAAAGSGAADSTRPGVLQIVAAAYPFQFIAERVAGAHAAVSNLTQPGAEPHDLELGPRQVASIASADFVIYERGFQPVVDEAVAQSENPDVLDTTTVVPLRVHDRQDESDEGHTHQRAESGPDPHVWLDPLQVATIANSVADRLAAIDPAGAADYQANVTRLDGQLTDLDASFHAGLTSCERAEFITTHAAFGYLAERYGLSQIGISGLSPDDEASPARIADIQQEAAAHGITTIFFETLVSPAVAKAVASDLGLVTDVLDPIEGITADSRGSDYLTVMSANLAALRKANGCP
jgi:zinc transport system substrate-binding protein